MHTGQELEREAVKGAYAAHVLARITRHKRPAVYPPSRKPGRLVTVTSDAIAVCFTFRCTLPDGRLTAVPPRVAHADEVADEEEDGVEEAARRRQRRPTPPAGPPSCRLSDSLAKTEDFRRTLARILDGVQVPRLHAVHSAHLADAINYAADVAANFDRLQAIYGDRRLHEARFTTRRMPSPMAGHSTERPAARTTTTTLPRPAAALFVAPKRGVLLRHSPSSVIGGVGPPPPASSPVPLPIQRPVTTKVCQGPQRSVACGGGRQATAVGTGTVSTGGPSSPS